MNKSSTPYKELLCLNKCPVLVKAAKLDHLRFIHLILDFILAPVSLQFGAI